MRRLLPLCIPMILASCGGGSGEGSAGSAGPCPEGPLTNASIMEGLKPTCVACHGPGSNKPFFASLTAFEDLLAYNTAYVVDGKPEESDLVRLLGGTGEGQFKQMPIGGEPYAARAEKGQAKVTMDTIKQWIQKLPQRATKSTTHLAAPTVRRLTAEQVLASFDKLLGLTDEDFFDLPLYDGVKDPSALPARSPDSLYVSQSYVLDQPQVYPRFEALGGPSGLSGKRRDTSLSPTFLGAVSQMAQARCRKAVEKPNNAAIFKLADPAMTSAGSEQAIRENIGYLFLRMLGEPATAAEVDDLYTSVYLAFEPTDTATAWTAVCAALVRHPLWLTY